MATLSCFRRSAHRSALTHFARSSKNVDGTRRRGCARRPAALCLSRLRGQRPELPPPHAHSRSRRSELAKGLVQGRSRKLSERIQDPDEAWLREPIFSGDNPAIIVIDGVESFASAHGYDTNSNSDWANLVREALAPLYQTGAAVVLVDHVVKNRQTSGDYPIGAVQKKGLCRGSAYSVDARNGVTRLVMRKDTHGQLGAGKGDHVAAVSGDYSASSTFLIPAAESKAAPTDHAARVRAFLRSHDGATAREIRDNVTGDNKAIAQVIEAMTQQGEIHPVKDGRKMRHHLVSP